MIVIKFHDQPYLLVLSSKFHNIWSKKVYNVMPFIEKTVATETRQGRECVCVCARVNMSLLFVLIGEKMCLCEGVE